MPTKYPEWAYADQLNKMQQSITKKREQEKAQQQREAIDFVPASATASGASSRSGTPSTAIGRAGPQSAAERVMAGLDREGASPGGRAAGSKRTESGMRKSRFDVR